MRCYSCNFALPEGKSKCINPKCRAWNVAAKVSLEDSTVLMSDAQMGSVEYAKTNFVDLCFGGGKGIARTSTALLGGEPGAGKTTLCLHLCDFFAGYYGKEALYIANEQDAKELKDTGERLELKHRNKIRIVKAMGGVTHDIGSLLNHYKPCLVVLDSVTNWVGEDLREAVLVCKRLKQWTVRLNAPSLIVNQVTKGGDHAGLNQLQHAVDTTLIFEVWGDNPDDPRRLHTRKNRFGKAPVSQYYEMTETGLFELTEQEALARLGEGPPAKTLADEVEEQDDSEEGEDEEDET